MLQQTSPHSIQSSEPESQPASTIELVTLTCDIHGEYEGYKSATASEPCRRCADVQYERDSRAEREARERRRLEGVMRALHDTAGIPRRFRERSFEHYQAVTKEQQLARAVCAEYADQWEARSKKARGLVLLGNTGTGKTHLACAIGNHVIQRHQATVSYGTVSDYAREVRSTFSRQKGERSEKQVMTVLTRDVHLTIIDEIGASRGTDFEMQLVFDLIDGRYREERPVIICSNLNAEQLEKYIGERAMDRLRQVAPIVAFPWDSHRGKQQGDLC